MNYLKSVTPYFTKFQKYNNKLQRYNNKLKTIGERYNKKFEGTIVEKWIRYWKQLYIDYRDVAIDVRKESTEKPLKAIGYLTGLSALWLFAKTNPDETSYRDAVLQSMTEVILVNKNSQRPSCVEHLRLIEKCYNTNYIRYTNFGIFSLVWVDNFSCDCDMYECQCEYLQLPYTKFFKRVIDIGFMNKWWLIEKHLEDYDINY